jgi:hypothetical protein
LFLLAAAAAAVATSKAAAQGEGESAPALAEDVARDLHIEIATPPPLQPPPAEPLAFTVSATARAAPAQSAMSIVGGIVHGDFARLSASGVVDFDLEKNALRFSSAAPVYLQRIEQDFAFSASDLDTLFNPFHTESLLDQAADLLERGLALRSEWDELAAKYLELVLEVGEYWALDAIHKEEESAGVYEVEAKEAQAQLAARKLESERTRRLADQLTGMREYVDNNKGKYVDASARQGWAGGRYAYAISGTSGGYTTDVWAGDTQQVSGHLKIASEIQAAFTLERQRQEVQVQIQTQIDSKDVLAAALTGLDARANWERANADFRKRRTATARQYQDLKSMSAFSENGALNHAKRLPALKQRFNRDFRDALARLRAASALLGPLYGFDEPMPNNLNALNYFDDCLVWTRDAIQWLIAFAQRDQSAVIPVSVRRQVGEDRWKQGRESGQWSFSLTPEFFEGLSHVRLRGVGLFVAGDDLAKSTWAMSVRNPDVGQAIAMDGRASALSQKRPAIRSWRVSTRHTVREPEIYGTSMLHNTSPIGGAWRISAVTPSGTKQDIDRSKLDDIVLDLHIVFRQQV